ncbi:DUF2889 domain-containing protein [Paraburkholderia sp. J11-2]|uniref:DUF2889 domain-containing protein n=1 Tax=Paraburkholderia sp. J11-2 TaxID=2805431 RepID=UPI002AB60F2B|nr:DUF2889 domain-containing protein [Paraburkholderia sp. J11-2]
MDTSSASPVSADPVVSRQLMHTRTMSCNGYLRSDGLLDIEGELRDITPIDTDLLFKRVPKDEPIHHMRIVMTLDAKMVIQNVTAHIVVGPTVYCMDIESAYAGLKGMQIGAGFRKQIKAVVGGVSGCTHLTELLGLLANTAMQTRFAVGRVERDGRLPADESGPMAAPAVINSCYTNRADGEAMKVLWPLHRRPKA